MLHRSLFLVIISFLTASSSFAQTQTVTTYYASPNGRYTNMNISGDMTISGGVLFPVPLGGCPAGLISRLDIVNFNGNFVVCRNGVVISNAGLWNNTGTSIFPSTTAGASLGIRTNNPQFPIDIGDNSNGLKIRINNNGGNNSGLGYNGTTLDLYNGTPQMSILTNGVTIPGNTTFGTVGAGNLTQVNGATTITGNTIFGTAGAGNVTQINGTTNVTGNTTFGTAGGVPVNTTTINGDATVQRNLMTVGTATVTGNTTFGTAGAGNTTIINGQLIIRNGATGVGGIQICNEAGTECGPLSLVRAGAPGNYFYYSQYAP